MAVELDGPVGVVRPGSWWRTRGATNFTRDQVKVLNLIAAIPLSQGGKKETWGTVPLAGPDGICASALAEAIWEFQQFWKAKGLFQNIDGVADPGGNTLKQLNRLSSPTPPPGPTDADIVTAAFSASRIALMTAVGRLRQLQTQANALAGMEGVARISALAQINLMFARDVAVISRRLLVPTDPGSQQFRAALDQVVSLIEQNISLPNMITITRNTGKCANPKPAFAWTTIGRKPPDTELCTSWVNAADDLRRDVVTHEYFHSVGLLDIEGVDTTDKALRNANTLAQIVALVADRTRQKNSDGNEPAVPPLPSP